MNTEKTNWLTDEACEALDVWEQRYRSSWMQESIDPAEVRADVEAHLWHARGESEEPVTLAQVKAAISEMGFTAPAEPYPLASAEKKKGIFAWCWRFMTHPFFLGVWPLVIVIWEMTTGMLASMFFDPISRTPQVILLLAFAILGVVCMMKAFEKRNPAWLIILRGAGLMVAGYWSFLMLPVLVMGTLGYGICVVYTIGIGLIALPLFLLCIATAAAPLYLFFGFLRNNHLSSQRTPWLIGMLVGIGLLLIVEGPAYVTRYGVANDDAALIRRLGSEEALMAMCYEGNAGRNSFTDTSGFYPNLGSFDMWDDGGSINAEDLVRRRELYYRVTGRAFNSLDDEKTFFNWSSQNKRRGVTFDENLGGDEVSARVADLDLATSRLDGHIDSASGLGYWEWTMEFHNSGSRNKEARMQLLLPSDAVVSRLTLWVNGEPQEAAFSSTAKVTKAYKSVAVKERRDPVLVRWVGADRVLVQCFPVLPTKDMRIRVGITAPLDSDGRLFLPRIIEKNFGIEDELDTSIWIQGDTEMTLDGLRGKGAKDKWRETHGTLSARQLMDQHTHVKCDLPEQPEVVWTDDIFAKNKLVRTRRAVTATESKDALVLVIDGSAYFSDWSAAVDDAIANLRNAGHEVQVIVAAHEEVIENPGSLSGIDFVGGQDCAPALEAGLNLAVGSGSRHLIWIHGSQPVQFSSEEGFLQLLERGFHQVDFSVVDLDGGPNRLLEKAAKRIGIAGAARPSAPEELFSEMERLLQNSHQQYEWRTQDEAPEGAKQVWDHLARWHVWKLVKKASIGSPDREKLAALAAKYQLVTPVSGAVVLETKEQYKRFGLEQADVSTTPKIPGIPEPSTALLTLLGSLMLWRRNRHGASIS